MNIIGLSCFYHDSASCLVRDGKIIAAAQEERFTRKKHDADFPKNAIMWCLKQGGLSMGDVDDVVFYDKPLLKFERILETALAYAPSGIRLFLQAMPLWLNQKLWIPELIRQECGFDGKILFCGHHESHAASAFYPSPFQEAAFLTIDGVGEWETTTLGVGKNNDLEILSYLKFPHSLGLLYSACTYYTGFKVNAGEYKVMGLAPYGEPEYVRLILDHLVDLKEDGSFRINMDYFGYGNGLKMTNARFEKLFGGPARKPETKITQKHMDIAASIQKVTEEIMLRMARHAHKTTGMDNLCLAGGVALNCVGNGRILREVLLRTSGFNRPAATPEVPLARPSSSGTNILANSVLPTAKKTVKRAPFSAHLSQTKKSRIFLENKTRLIKNSHRTILSRPVQGLSPQAESLAGFRGRWNSAPERWAAAAFLATRATHKCSQG